MPRQVLRERCFGRIINPVRQLCRGKHVAEVSLIAGDQDMLARGDDGRNHQVCIALPSPMPLTEAFHHSRTGYVEHDDLKLGEHLLRVQQPLVRKRCLGRSGLQGKVAPPMQHFGDND
jgi:hypothetical protein